MRRTVRSSVLAAAVVAVALLAPSGRAAPLPTAVAPMVDGPLLSQVEAVGNGAVQHLDRLDGTRTLLPFLPGSEADFSPDGSRLVYLGATRNPAGVFSDAVLVRTASGATSVLAFLLADDVRWSGDGTYVVASAIDPGTGAWSLWRLTPGAAPVKVLETPADRPGQFFDVDPDSDVVGYVSNQDVYTVDAKTKVTGQLTHNCETVDTCSGPFRIVNLDWAPAGDRMAVLYRQPDPDPSLTTEGLGWLTPGTDAPVPIVTFDPAVLGFSARVSPGGGLIAVEVSDQSFNGSHTEVVDASGSSVATLLPALSDVAWQPCPSPRRARSSSPRRRPFPPGSASARPPAGLPVGRPPPGRPGGRRRAAAGAGSRRTAWRPCG